MRWLTPRREHERTERRDVRPGIDPDDDIVGDSFHTCSSIVAAPVKEMPLPPSGSKFSAVTTPSLSSAEKRLTRLPRPARSTSRPRARAYLPSPSATKSILPAPPSDSPHTFM